MQINKYIASKLAQSKKNKGLTYKDISSRTGFGFFLIRDVLSCRREVRLEEFISLCLVLDIDPISLLSEYYEIFKKEKKNDLAGIG